MKYLIPVFVFLMTALAFADYEKGCLSAFAKFRVEMSSHYALDESKKKNLQEDSDETEQDAEKLVKKSVDKSYEYGLKHHEC